MIRKEFEHIKDYFGFYEGINGKEELFNSVVLVLLIEHEGEYHFVLEKRNPFIRQGGEICFPGGKIDDLDESLEKTAIRETKEELGIPEHKIKIYGRLNTVVALMGATVDGFIGIADIELEEIIINKEEVEELIVLPVAFFENNQPERYSVKVAVHPSYTDEETGDEVVLLPVEALGLPKRYKKPWGNYHQGILVYKTEYGPIWGITARIIHEFVDKINQLKKQYISD